MHTRSKRERKKIDNSKPVYEKEKQDKALGTREERLKRSTSYCNASPCAALDKGIMATHHPLPSTLHTPAVVHMYTQSLGGQASPAWEPGLPFSPSTCLTTSHTPAGWEYQKVLAFPVEIMEGWDIYLQIAKWGKFC